MSKMSNESLEHQCPLVTIGAPLSPPIILCEHIKYCIFVFESESSWFFEILCLNKFVYMLVSGDYKLILLVE